MSTDQVEAAPPAPAQPPLTTATIQNAPIFAGRAFAKHYQSALSAGERAVLRRAEVVSTNAAFWSCLQKAEKVWPDAKLPRNVRIFEALIASAILEDAGNGDDMGSVGAFMRRNGKQIKSRRVEAMLAAQTREAVVEELSRLVAITRAQRATIDFGMLFSDLVFFGDHVRRRWAADCFA